MTTVRTTYGTLEGVQREGHLTFRGIPYAAPPVGDLRWRAPQPPAAWQGVRKSDTFGNASRQKTHPIPGFAASGPQSEDCLYLDIYTPAADDRRRPVMFWIHGGGFTHGTASEPLYDGGPLVTRGDVVVVGINYRLGALGFLSLIDLLPGRGLTANAGLLDCIAALEWVRDNIAAFGGDPANVTIFGESAGAAAVGTLLAMPAAKGLFHKAVLQSGTGRANTREGGTRIADLLLANLGMDRAGAAELLTTSDDRILEAQTAIAAKMRFDGGPLFGPVIDDENLPDLPINEIAAGSAAGIPVMAGTNRDEVKLFMATVRRDPIDDEELLNAVQASLGSDEAKAASLVAAYRSSRGAKGLPDSNLDILDAIQSDARMRMPAIRLALAQRAHQPLTYMYLFTYPSPARGGSLGSCHALEMPFVFGTLHAPTQDRFAGSGPEVEALSRRMMDAWLSFARTGSPGHEGIGAWPAYDDSSRPTMVFDLETGLESDPFGEERRAIQGVL